jgi:acyl transferase domain-containing protein
MWVAGVSPDWMQMQTGPRRRIALPTYPFERKRFWVEPAPLAADAASQASAAAGVEGPVGRGNGSVADDSVPADIEELLQKQLALMAEQIKTFMPGA